jgi:hypothetical protein
MPLPRRRIERRFYTRTFDLNSPGWRAIREQAETCRTNVHHIFDKAALDAVVPPPAAPVPREESAVAGIKCLLGFFLWSKGRL